MRLLTCFHSSKDERLRAFASCTLAAKLEVQSRLCKLYPDAIISHQPSDAMQPWRDSSHDERPLQQPIQREEGSVHQPGERPLQQPSREEGCALQPPEERRRVEAEDDEEAAATALIGGDAESVAGMSVGGSEAPPRVDAHQVLANAAVPGDAFQWHVDADPSDLMESAWTQEHGRYFNRVRSGAGGNGRHGSGNISRDTPFRPLSPPPT